MLDADEVRELCRRRDAGVAAEAASHVPAAATLLRSVTPSERQALVEDGSRARTEMIEGSLGLVRFAVHRFRPAAGLDRDDYFQEGVLGLARAADRFDPQQAAFSTFAVPHIRGAVLTMINTRGGDITARQAQTAARIDRELDRRREAGLPTDSTAVARSLRITEGLVVDAYGFRPPTTLTPTEGPIDVADRRTQDRIDDVGHLSPERLIFMLPAAERQALHAVYSETSTGRSMVDIAADIGCSVYQLARSVRSGRAHLHELMTKPDTSERTGSRPAYRDRRSGQTRKPLSVSTGQ